MAEIVGTYGGDDTLVGTEEADVLIALGGDDSLSGLAGGDEYRLRQASGASSARISDLGGDGAIDVITGGKGIYASASLGYQAWATAERIGDDLSVTLPGKPSRFRDPGYGELKIEIKDHYAGDPVEYLVAGGTTYWLSSDANGTSVDDIIAGRSIGEIHKAFGGDDLVDAGDGNDRVLAGDGDDVVFGGAGNDVIKGGDGADHLYDALGENLILGGKGQDWIESGDGDNEINAGAGHDFVFAGIGDDLVKGGGGWDQITGFDGDDRLIGGKGGDTYRFGYDREALGTTDHWGHDTVRDNGNAAIYDTSIGTYGAWRYDTLEFFGLYGPSDGNISEALAGLRIERILDDMLIAGTDGLSSVTVENQFLTGTDKFYVEQVKFNAGYWSPVLFRVASGEHEDIGDDRGGKAGLNEFLFGTDAADQIFSDAGLNLIWTGAGQDSLIYKESDPDGIYDIDGNWVSYTAIWDVVMDFDPAGDVLDFTEIEGLGLAGLDLSEDGEGDAVIAWDSGTFEIADIKIELRGVGLAEVDDDMFLFG